ncbi:MAG: SAM-dependent chlorinase/fluorinase [Pseudomonadota bacterium]
MPFRPTGLVTLLTDFGDADTYVSQMKAVMLGVAPDLRFVDISHEVAPQDIAQGAFLLAEAARWFPAGTVHLAVVDPGVGSARGAIAMIAGEHAFIGPNNGLMTPAALAISPDPLAWSLDHVPSPHGSRSATFHGRDLFSPAAALVAAGLRTPESLGSPARPSPAPASTQGSPDVGRVLHVDRFGNLITSFPSDLFDGVVAVEVGGQVVSTAVRCYAEAPAGAPVFLIGSSGRIEVAVAGGSAARALGVLADAVVCLRRS